MAALPDQPGEEGRSTQEEEEEEEEEERGDEEEGGRPDNLTLGAEGEVCNDWSSSKDGMW